MLIFFNKIFGLVFKSFLYFYKAIISPFLGNHCRFSPSCSIYMLNAITELGPWQGVKKGLARFLQCHPWGKNPNQL